MRRLFLLALPVIFLAVALVPPWYLTWAPADATAAPVSAMPTFGGFRFWTYASARPTTTLAWDGPNTGGHAALVGTPSVAFGAWAGLLMLSGGLWYAGVRRRPPASMERP